MRFYSVVFGVNVANFCWALDAGNPFWMVCAVVGAGGSLLHEVTA